MNPPPLRTSLAILLATTLVVPSALPAITAKSADPALISNGTAALTLLRNQLYNPKLTLSGNLLTGRSPNSYTSLGRRGGIWMVDLEWFLTDDPTLNQDRIDAFIRDFNNYRPLITMHWHWPFNGEAVRKADRTTQVNMANIITPGTAEYVEARKELAVAAQVLKKFEQAQVPILWRPLHEIDGPHFWWSDTTNPSNTAEFYRQIFSYLTTAQNVHNLIWVYNVIFDGSDANRDKFFPGAACVDIMSCDPYSVESLDPSQQTAAYWKYWDYLDRLDATKLKAMAECWNIPNPDKATGDRATGLPIWVYCIPWDGTPKPNQPFAKAKLAYNHSKIITLDEMPKFGSGAANLRPEVGIVSPDGDNGSSWVESGSVRLTAKAKEREGGQGIAKVEFYTFDETFKTSSLIGTATSPDANGNYNLSWNAPAGFHQVYVKAVNNQGTPQISDSLKMGESHTSWFNYSWVTKGYRNAAAGKSVTASSMLYSPDSPNFSYSDPKNLTDASYSTVWMSKENSNKATPQWAEVDLGQSTQINRVIVRLGWAVPKAFKIQVSTDRKIWTTVYTATNVTMGVYQGYDRGQPTSIGEWGFPIHCPFNAALARWVRFYGTDSGGSTRYELSALEVPVP